MATQKYGLMLKHGICQTELAFSVVLGALGEFALLMGSVRADGALEQCWGGWVSSGRDDM